MSYHPFSPDPVIPGVCAAPDCGMPKANRRHTPEPAAEPPARPLRPADSNYAHTALDATGSSANAALRAAPKSGTVKSMILDVVVKATAQRGVTDKELEQHIPGFGPNTLRPRRVDLMHDGWLCPARDEWHDEVTRDGATAWTLTPAARATLADSAA